MAKQVTVVITKENSDRYRREGINASLAASKAEPTAYENLKSSVFYILANKVDIEEWEYRAIEIADFLKLLMTVSKGTYFYFPWKNINPEMHGKASTLRSQCKQLAGVFKMLNK